MSVEYKTCTRCGEVKPVVAFRWKRKAAGEREAACAECRREDQRRRIEEPGAREYERERLRRAYRAAKEDPERHARQRERWHRDYLARKARAQADPEYAERIRENRRRYIERVKADPERYAKFMHNRRIDRALRAEAESEGVRLVPAVDQYRRPVGNDRGALLPAEPFRLWLERRFGAWTRVEVAAKLGVSERRLLDISTGRQRFVHIDTVDRAFTNFGDPGLLYRIYGDAIDDLAA